MGLFSNETNADTSAKQKALAADTVQLEGSTLTTDQGVRLPTTDDSLKVGPRGPSLLEDFHLREKLTRFDHERIPERVVHARGSAAHGFFQVYKPQTKLTAAGFLGDPDRKTPVFVRFSTVVGSRGSADTVRDARGFAVKFYTEEGNFDLVGNNIPVFFIQDGIKFPDIVHAVKPEPHNEMPAAASAHDSFWDFVSLVPESTHMVMWVMSDRGIPRSYRMMEGFGVHTFRMVNDKGVSTFVKFHWKPLLGAHSLVWDEAQKLAGFDPDFHRRDLWETLEAGNVVEFELGVQIIAEKDSDSLGFDLLDATKLLPEEAVAVQPIGKLTLNRNPDNFFAETEQVAFCISNLVPGIDVTDDPLLQARLFSYLDTQLSRLGSPNFAEIPINRPLAPVTNHQQDGHMRQKIVAGRANYSPNTVGGGCPMMASPGQGGYTHFPAALAGSKVRERSASFSDHFSQPAMFLASMSPPERLHMVKAFRFELSKVTRVDIRERVVAMLAQVDGPFATDVAAGLGLKAPTAKTPAVTISPALSIIKGPSQTIATRKVAFLCAPGVNAASVNDMRSALEGAGAIVEVIAPILGTLATGVEVSRILPAAPSVLFDAVFIADGDACVASLIADRGATFFIEEAYTHGKAVAAASGASAVLDAALPKDAPREGVVGGSGKDLAEKFVAAIALHRHWSREGFGSPPN